MTACLRFTHAGRRTSVCPTEVCVAPPHPRVASSLQTGLWSPMKVGLGAEAHPAAHVMQPGRLPDMVIVCGLTAAALLITQCALLMIVLGAGAAVAQQVEAPAPAAPLPTPAEPLATCTKDVRAANIEPMCRASGCASPASHLAVPVQPPIPMHGYEPSLCAV